MRELYDAAVVGGGPAGAIVALTLARLGRKVCLFEATHWDEERYGETLPPEINPVLRELGVYDEFLALAPLESPGIVSVWGGTAPGEQDFLRNPHGPGWHVDRNRFDRMLCMQAGAAGTECFCSETPEVRRDAELWHAGDIDARFLVDASGRNGLRIDGDGGREIEDRLLAIVMRMEHPEEAPSDLRTLIESAPAGWWYSARLPQGQTIAMFFTDCDIYAREGIVLEEQLGDASVTRDRLRSGVLKGARIVHVTSSCRTEIAGESWLAAGDSASCYDPLSGRGIFKALRQGANAGMAVDAYLRGDPQPLGEYATLVRKEFDSYVVQRHAYYAAERRWAGLEFWSRR